MSIEENRGVDVELLADEIGALRTAAQRYGDAMRSDSGSVGEAGLDLEKAAIRYVRKLDDESVYANPEIVGRLEQSVTDNIKRFEYQLRRRLDQNASQVFLSGTDDVPEQYRKLVEQYYRSLSKGGGKQ